MKHAVLPPLWRTTKTTTRRDQIISLVFFLSAIVIGGSIRTNVLVESFATNNNNISSKRQRNYKRSTATAPKNFHGCHAPAIVSVTRCNMVRNIDLVEALIFYGTAGMVRRLPSDSSSDTSTFLPGVENLLEECQRDDTSVIAILDHERDLAEMTNNDSNHDIHFRTMTSPPPNPYDLWESIHSIEIQPKGFGGSSGFGRKAADPERPPSPSRCVVLCDTTDKCRAARSAGMRVLCLTDNELADGVMNFGIYNDDETKTNDDNDSMNNLEYYWESITMDDIATPGSFWLNPPLPKDDEGNGVNIYSVIQSFENNNNNTHQQEDDSNPDVDEDDNENLEAILMDMDPL